VKHLHWDWLVAIALGLGLGLTYAWVVAPAHGGNTSPQSLRSDYQDQFRSAIAAAYSATGDLERARARLTLLGDQDPAQALGAQAQRALAAGMPFGEAQDLARLASDLQSGVSSLPSPTPAAAPLETPFLTITPTPVGLANAAGTTASLPATAGGGTQAVPTATQSATPTRTPMPSPSAPFQLLAKEEVCEPAGPAGLLQITVLDRLEKPMPGIEITITWSDGEERFYTGFQPEISDGYADYVMQAGTSYSVQVARLGAPLSDLAAPACIGPAGQIYFGGLKLTFKEP